MSRYIHFKHPSGKDALVHQGFSWPAFLFGPFWAIAKRQWILGAWMALAFVAANLLAGVAQASGDLVLLALSLVVLIGYMVVCGLYGNRWHRHYLERAGYRGDD